MGDGSWFIEEDHWDLSQYKKGESLFALSNGTLGVRGSFEEPFPEAGHDGFYMNGFYENYPLQYGEFFPGYPRESQAMVNLPNPKYLNLKVDGEILIDKGTEPDSYKRSLDLKSALLTRDIVLETGKGGLLEVSSERFVSAVHQNLFCMRYSVKVLKGDCSCTLSSGYDLSSRNLSKEDDPRVGVEFSADPLCRVKPYRDGNDLSLTGHIRSSGLDFGSFISHKLTGSGDPLPEWIETDEKACLNWQISIRAGETVTLDKLVWYEKNPDVTDESGDRSGFPGRVVFGKGYDALKAEHCRWWRNAWDNMDVSIQGNPELQQGIRFNMFHLLQSVGKDGLTNMPAKGMTGEGYEGHYFWDTEIYMIPFFTFTNPAIARKLLEYRYNTLDKARIRAKEMGHRQGALYPWRTIDGSECSSYFPAGTAQYHINADIAHAIKVYWEGTGDLDFLLSCGLEILIETNRLWADLAYFNDKSGQYVIQNVTGPDEYTALVDNNYYTNRMVKDQFSFFSDILGKFSRRAADDPRRIQIEQRLKALNVKEDELNLWAGIGNHIYLPSDEERGITPQDDRFLEKPLWDIPGTPRSHFPLLMHYHPLVLYRYQVCKQPDVILAQFLLSQEIREDQKIRDFDYYKKITTHDSSLSYCIFGCMAADIGRIDESFDFYVKTARTDLDDRHGNVKDGIHAANMAGSWIGLSYGFARMRHRGGDICFSPLIPASLQSYSFRIFIGSTLISVRVNHKNTIYRVLKGEEVNLFHYGRKILVGPEEYSIPVL